MRQRCLIFLVFAFAMPAFGGELYRCVAVNGAVSYQDAPCASGSALSRTIQVEAEDAPDEGPRKSGKAAKTAKTGKINAAPRAKSDARSRQRASCAKAREARDVALERMGLNRTFEQLSALDRRVGEACKGL
jgi:hypothetical protein